MIQFFKRLKWLGCGYFLFCLPFLLSGQQIQKDTLLRSTTLWIVPTNVQEIFPDNLPRQYTLSDSSAIIPSLNTILDSLRQASFFSASIDSLVQQDTASIAYIFLGNQYNSLAISNGNIEKNVLKRTGIEGLLTKKITYKQLLSIQETLLNYAENNGYPFASSHLDNLRIDTTVTGKLYLQKGKRIRLGTIKTEGSAPLSSIYLANYLGLRKGDLYQKDKIIAASQRIQELPFVKEVRSPSVNFKGEKATISLFLEPQKANRFDFLIGVLPNNTATGKVLITGNIDAAFQNQFGKGEKLRFKFEQLRPETQQLELAINYPYLASLPLGIDFDFGLFKRDSTYRDVNWSIGLQYLLAGNNYLKAFSKNTASALLTIDESAIIRNRQLPQSLDIRNTAFGLGYHWEKFDYRFNPRSGWLLELEGSAGFKEIKKNAKITGLQDETTPDFNFSGLYDALDLTTFQYQLTAQVDKYFPIQKRSALKIGLQGATILSETPILQNEQFRIGGNNLLRGFDEASIFATSYVVGTLEYRYLIGQNSYFFLFGDMAYVENKTTVTTFSNRPIGIGAGMTFETKVGIFGISYALGKLDNVAFEFRTAKVHFGFVSLF